MKTLKAMAVATALVIGTTTARSATSYMFDNPDNTTYFGARIALDISSAANGGGAYSNKAGFSAGAVYHIPLWMNLYFEPGLSVFLNNFGCSSWQTTTVQIPNLNPDGTPVLGPDNQPIIDEKDFSYQQDGTIRNFGFRIPMIVGYHFDFAEDVKVHVYTGPQLNINLLARYHREAVYVPSQEQEAETFGIFGTGGFKTLDFQWNFGVGLTWQTYYLGLGGAWGLTHMKSSTEMLPRDLRRNLFSITLGYNF